MLATVRLLAAVNLTVEYWHLVRFLIALLQPVLVLALIGGLMVATAHLLTMIGTRWGDRRASSKAMFFSIVIHLLLIIGLVTLIPEYRSNLISKLAEFDGEPIRISMLRSPSGEAGEETSEKGGSGSTGMFHALTRPTESVIEPERTRTDAPAQAAAELQSLPKPADAAPAMAMTSLDRTSLPEPAPAQPKPEKPQPATPLPSATADVKTESMPIQNRPEATAVAKPPERSSVSPAVANQEAPAAPARPNAMNDQTTSGEFSPDRLPPDQAEVVRPQMELSRTDVSAAPLSTSPGPVPAMSQPVTALPRPVPAAASGNGLENRVSRTESRTQIPSMDDLRPVRPAQPESTAAPSGLGRMDSPPGLASSSLPLLDEKPELSRSPDPFSRSGTQDRIPSAYQLRTEEEREKALLQFGGTDASEAAVDMSLKWMASVQNPAGYWGTGDYGGAGAAGANNMPPQNTGRDADVGVTALAVLAFLGKLNTVDQGEYSPQVNKALRWLVSQQTTKSWGEGWGSTAGYLGGNATEFDAMYCHAMATFALGEAYAMSRDNPQAQWLRSPLEQAVYFILDVQNVDGGWRYIKGQREGDMSIFGWQVMALKSAEAAGMVIDPQRKLRMQKFLQQRQLGQAGGGLAGYRSNEAANAAVIAEALYCRQVLGLAQDNQSTQAAIQMMMENLPRKTTLNFYYWYYGTLAMHHHGGPQWETWNVTVRDLLVAEQRNSGPLAGSWDPRDIWGGYGGRMYSTAIATLSLEVYYRYLPLYRLQRHQ